MGDPLPYPQNSGSKTNTGHLPWQNSWGGSPGPPMVRTVRIPMPLSKSHIRFLEAFALAGRRDLGVLGSNKRLAFYYG